MASLTGSTREVLRVRRRSIPLVAVALSATLAPALGAQQLQVGSSSRASTGWLGLTYSVEVPAPLRAGADAFPLLVVRELYRSGPAERAGLHPGDVIVRVNGATARDGLFRSLAARLQPGDPVVLSVRRDGATLDLAVEAGVRPDEGELLPRVLQVKLDSVRVAFQRRLDSLRVRLDGSASELFFLSQVPEVHVTRLDRDSLSTHIVLPGGGSSSVRLERVETPEGFTFRYEIREAPDSLPTPTAVGRTVGTVTVRTAPRSVTERSWRPLTPLVSGANRVAGAELAALNPALGSYFGVDRGLLVVSVAEGTPALEAGLLAGDVIQSAGGNVEVSSVERLRSILARAGGHATLGVLRKGKHLELTLR